jgi:hypothetical protein
MIATVRAWLRRKAARHWPSAEATVQSTAVAVSINGEMPEETIDIQSAGVDAFLTEGSPR